MNIQVNKIGNHFESEIAALRWLAAKLEELTDGE